VGKFLAGRIIEQYRRSQDTMVDVGMRVIKHLGVLHRRDAEAVETSQRGGGKRILIPSLRPLCASAVNSSVVFLALLFFQLWRFSVKELLATYIAAWSNDCRSAMEMEMKAVRTPVGERRLQRNEVVSA
jgi:hypothetical protein